MERLKRRIVDLERYSQRLKDIMPKTKSDYLKADTVIKSATERNLQLVSDIEIEVLILLYKMLDLSIASDEVSLLEKFNGKISDKVLSKIKERRELRNILVHAYSNRSYDEKVYGEAANLEDVNSFIKEVERLVEKQLTGYK